MFVTVVDDSVTYGVAGTAWSWCGADGDRVQFAWPDFGSVLAAHAGERIGGRYQRVCHFWILSVGCVFSQVKGLPEHG